MVPISAQSTTRIDREYLAPELELRDFKESDKDLKAEERDVSELVVSPNTVNTLKWLLSLNRRSQIFTAQIPSSDSLFTTDGSLTVIAEGVNRIDLIHIRNIVPSEKAKIDDKAVGLARTHLIIGSQGTVLNGSITNHYNGMQPQTTPITKGNCSLAVIQEDIIKIARTILNSEFSS